MSEQPVTLTDQERERLAGVLSGAWDRPYLVDALVREFETVAAAAFERGRQALAKEVREACWQCHGSGLVQGDYVGEPRSCPSCDWVRAVLPPAVVDAHTSSEAVGPEVDAEAGRAFADWVAAEVRCSRCETSPTPCKAHRAHTSSEQEDDRD